MSPLCSEMYVCYCGDNVGEITHARHFKEQNCDYSLMGRWKLCDFPSVTSRFKYAMEFMDKKSDLRLFPPKPRALLAKWGLINPLIDWLIAQNPSLLSQ